MLSMPLPDQTHPKPLETMSMSSVPSTYSIYADGYASENDECDDVATVRVEDLERLDLEHGGEYPRWVDIEDSDNQGWFHNGRFMWISFTRPSKTKSR